MQILKVALKLIGLNFLVRALILLFGFIMLLTQPYSSSLYYLLMQGMNLIMSLTISIFLIITPKWLITILGMNLDSDTSNNLAIAISTISWLKLGILLIGFYYFIEGTIQLATNILSYAISFSTNNYDLTTQLKKEFTNGIKAIVTIIVSVIVIMNINVAEKLLNSSHKGSEET